MTKKINGVLLIYPEAPQQCDFCGEIAELRPYGPNGECICFDCGMKNPETTEKKFNELLDDVDGVVRIHGPRL